MRFCSIRFAWIICLFCLSIPAPAQPEPKHFEFNDNCQLAYKEIISLKLEEGQNMLNEEKKKHPANLIPYFLENYIDFFVLYFNEDPAEFALRKVNLDRRLQIMNEGPPSSPFYLFTKAVIHFQWAAVNIKFGNNWDAGWEFRRSFLQIKENESLFPSFSPDAMLGGAMQVAAGTIPDGYKWLSNLLGIRGSVKEGISHLEQFIGLDDPMAKIFHDEAVFYYLYLQFYIQNRRDEVFEFISSNKLDIINNHLFTFLAANLAVNAQQSAYAEKILLARNNDPSYLEMPAWDFETGAARLNHLETDANTYLEKYISNFKGKFYVKEVLQKLSWYYYLGNDSIRAEHYRKLILQKGSTDTEADKQALKEAKTAQWPDKTLLRARLLDDGGYLTEALAMLKGKSSSDFSVGESRLEFTYRLGRIYDDLGRQEEAIAAYLSAIKTGSSSKTYYPARSALQIGFIYEKQKNLPMAISYYQKCLDFKDHDYKNSLDQKAKAGIARCKQE